MTVASAATILVVQRSNRTETYRTGEQHAEITRNLDRKIPDGAPSPDFVDVTAEAGLSGFRSFAGLRTSQLPEDMGSGGAWGDFDNDGDDDLFLVSNGGPLGMPEAERAPSLLYENRGDGTFSVVAGFPDTRIHGMGASWGDYDRDGWLDLVVTGYDALRLFHNEHGTLVADTAIADRAGYFSGASWSDFDRDGDLDLYVCGYVQYVPDDRGRQNTSKQYGRSVPYTLNPASYKPANNLLFRNSGAGEFEEVAERMGVSNPSGRSLGALWHDLDEDGWPDLYVANDISDNALYRNREGTFEDVSHAAWVADYRGAMGLAAGDWNRDGDDDLLVTHWVAQENALYDSLLADQRGSENASLRFVDVADQRGLGQVALRHVGWGVQFADFDSDGWLDLTVANGSTFEEEGDEDVEGAPRWLTPEKSFLFWNDHGRRFHDLAPDNEALSKPSVGRGVALSDYDRDGDVDILFVDSGGGARLLRNEIPQGNWIELNLRARPGEAGAGFVDGARVVARVGDVQLRRTVSSASYLSQSSRTVHIGLGEAGVVDSIEVHWPLGGTDRFDALEANAIWELHEGDPAPVRSDGAPADAPVELTREQLSLFWKTQRAGVKAMKVEGNIERAVTLFREALALNPVHQDSLYFLGNCLAEQGHTEQALQQFARLKEIEPLAHRAHKRWGTLRAMTATRPEQFEQAEQALARAVEINPEATGALTVLGEVNLIRGDHDAARRNLAFVCRTNPGAREAFFIRAYIAWRDGDDGLARELLQAATVEREVQKASGSVEEGDVRELMHDDKMLLGRFLEAWTGSLEPDESFGRMDAFVRERQAVAASRN